MEAAERDLLERFARLALDCVHRPYPTQLAHRMSADEDALPPRALTPVFYGCYDWHSAVHGHWLLAHAARVLGDRPVAHEARAALARSFAAAAVDAEVRYLRDRPTFERPYGLAWLLTLHAELLRWEDPQARTWARLLKPLVQVARGHMGSWLPRLSHPVRSGVHSQTAFALGLVHDWARAAEDGSMAALVDSRGRSFFGTDRDYPLHLEPGGEDFLSPSLGAADLMARLLSPAELASWLDRTMPQLDRSSFRPVAVTDPTDGRLAHLDGLNLSRAWMMVRVARGLPPADRRRAILAELAEAHRTMGLSAVSGQHYEGAHWLGTFATMLIRGD